MPGRNPSVRYLTPEEIREQLLKLSKADVNRLVGHARLLLGLVGARDPDLDRSIVHDLTVLMLTDVRGVPGDLPFLAVAFNHLRSLVFQTLRDRNREVATEPDDLAPLAHEALKADCQSQWRIATRAQTAPPEERFDADRRLQEVLNSFEDPLDRQIVEGFFEGMTANELEASMQPWTHPIQFKSKLKAIRRKLGQMFPGWTER